MGALYVILLKDIILIRRLISANKFRAKIVKYKICMDSVLNAKKAIFWINSKLAVLFRNLFLDVWSITQIIFVYNANLSTFKKMEYVLNWTKRLRIASHMTKVTNVLNVILDTIISSLVTNVFNFQNWIIVLVNST